MKKKNLDRRPQELEESKGKEQKSKNKIVAALLIASLASGFCFGAWATPEIKAAELTPATTQVEMQHQQAPEYHDRLIETQAELDELRTKPPEIITIEVPVEIIKEVPVIVEVDKNVPRKFREFEDLAELTGWLEKNGLPIVLIANKDGRTDLLNPKSTSQYDCDDYAEALQRKALGQGFLMSQQLISNGKIYGVKISKHTEPHMGNLTVIGNDIYYIESMPPHSVVRITSRD